MGLQVCGKSFLTMTAYNEGSNPIALYREQAGLTQEQLAAQSGVTVDYLDRLEKGTVPRLTVRLKPIADVLGVPVEDLVGHPL
jgi:transcriptional regulator with XRE-family HTH domain